jgi:hypothetical protein
MIRNIAKTEISTLEKNEDVGAIIHNTFNFINKM